MSILPDESSSHSCWRRAGPTLLYPYPSAEETDLAPKTQPSPGAGEAAPDAPAAAAPGALLARLRLLEMRIVTEMYSDRRDKARNAANIAAAAMAFAAANTT